jgi:phage gp36-like protein
VPKNLDILFERLKQFDEVAILELLDIKTEELLERFKDKVNLRREHLYGEVELLVEDEEDELDEWDGFQIEEPFEEEEE